MELCIHLAMNINHIYTQLCQRVSLTTVSGGLILTPTTNRKCAYYNLYGQQLYLITFHEQQQVGNTIHCPSFKQVLSNTIWLTVCK